MYAIIKTGGKQYRVEEGSILRVDLLPLDEGSDFDIDQILLIKTGENDYKVGTPTVEGARVGCKVLNHEKGKKIVVFKKKKRKGYRRKMGHRQNYSRIQVTEIKA